MASNFRLHGNQALGDLVLFYTTIIDINHMVNQKMFAVTLPKELLEHLDTIRGDIPRSRYIRRVLEKKFEEDKK
jgi:hypothetical protein